MILLSANIFAAKTNTKAQKTSAFALTISSGTTCLIKLLKVNKFFENTPSTVEKVCTVSCYLTL